MTSVEVFTIFWGSAWTKDPQKPLVAQVNQFFDSILGSALIDQLLLVSAARRRVVQGGAASCQAFCDYHNATSSGIFYAVMPYPGCTGCRGDLTVFEALTLTSSHELCEAITDPIPGAGWYDDMNGEIGDICAWQTKKVGLYTVQLEWSNRTGTCV